MAIEYQGKVYRNLQEQVLKNKNDIEELENRIPGGGSSEVTRYEFNALSSRVSTAEGEIGQLEEDLVLVDNAAKMALSMTQNVAERALKTPTSAPTATQLVGVDTSNDQEMIEIGSGLALVENVLYATGGGGSGSGKYLHIIKFAVYTETYQYGQLILLLNTSTNFTGTDNENSPTYDQFWDLGMAMGDAGYTTVSVLAHEDSQSGTFTSLSFKYDNSGENMLVVSTSDGETIGFDSFSNFIDTVIPV